MFDIGWSEMLVVGAVALVVIGPKDLPAALRTAGKWMGAVRRMAADFQGQVNQAMKDAELDELRREVSNLKSGMGGMDEPFRSAGDDVRRAVEAKPAPEPLPPPASTSAQPDPAAPAPAAAEAAEATDPPAVKPKPKRAPRKKAAATESKT
jgi:sec-independent protein translocase protein TatB